MRRHAKTLQAKAKKNSVQPAANRGEFTVTSSTSGNRYTVTALANGGFACTCDWANWHDTSVRPCSHVLSVIAYLEQAGDRAAAFWAEETDAERQHRRTERVGLGLWMTTRKAG